MQKRTFPRKQPFGEKSVKDVAVAVKWPTHHLCGILGNLTDAAAENAALSFGATGGRLIELGVFQVKVSIGRTTSTTGGGGGVAGAVRVKVLCHRHGRQQSCT